MRMSARRRLYIRVVYKKETDGGSYVSDDSVSTIVGYLDPDLENVPGVEGGRRRSKEGCWIPTHMTLDSLIFRYQSYGRYGDCDYLNI